MQLLIMGSPKVQGALNELTSEQDENHGHQRSRRLGALLERWVVIIKKIYFGFPQTDGIECDNAIYTHGHV
jgi:hypothetical protein